MNKLLFLSHIKKDDANGVWKKIASQVASLKKIGFLVDYTYFNENDVFVINKSGAGEIEVSRSHRYLCFFKLVKFINEKYDYVYLRKPHGGAYPLFCPLLINKIKSKSKKTNVFMEIPTYPFKNESKSIKNLVGDSIFELSMFFQKKNVDKILCVGNPVERIYGIPTQEISNGINFESYIPVQKKKNKNSSSIVFLGVANLVRWHGYDRLIDAISKYSGSEELRFMIVGDTEPELSRLKNIAKEQKIEDKIDFLGKKGSTELLSIYAETDICVDSLGRHRSNMNSNSSIKSKEYSAMGIPFIKSHFDQAFSDNPDFVFDVSPDENELDLNGIIKWYRNLPDDFSKYEIEYARNKFSWDEIFRAVFNKY